MPTARFCQLVGVPEQSYRRWQAEARAGHPPKGPCPAPVRLAHREDDRRPRDPTPAWGHRKIWATAHHGDYRVLQSSELGTVDDAGLPGWFVVSTVTVWMVVHTPLCPPVASA